jgi:hypothetical protein
VIVEVRFDKNLYSSTFYNGRATDFNFLEDVKVLFSWLPPFPFTFLLDNETSFEFWTSVTNSVGYLPPLTNDSIWNFIIRRQRNLRVSLPKWKFILIVFFSLDYLQDVNWIIWFLWHVNFIAFSSFK